MLRTASQAGSVARRTLAPVAMNGGTRLDVGGLADIGTRLSTFIVNST